MSLTIINAIWIGPILGPVHAACLRSFVRHGHRTVLHVYERPCDVPDGVELADAGKLLPQERTVRHSATGSLAVFADFLRYEIQKQGLGLYVDCDCYCLQPVEDDEHIFGLERSGSIANGVLKLPADCATTRQLCRLKDDHSFIPPWASKKRRAYYRWRARLGFPVSLPDMPWGFTGPHALTWYLQQSGLDRRALPIDTFYPVHHGQTPLLLDRDLEISDITTRRTKLLHLSNERIRHVDLSQVAPSSPLGVIMAS